VVRPSQTRFYPVTLKEEGKFLITVRYREGKWQFASFEETDNAYNMVRLMSANKFMGGKDLNLYAIEIPALHLSHAKEAPIFTFTRLRTQDQAQNTADAVLRPRKGGLRCSVTHKIAFLDQRIQ
jgi:hypothetical protein